jgi:hypothetical protein
MSTAANAALFCARAHKYRFYRGFRAVDFLTLNLALLARSTGVALKSYNKAAGNMAIKHVEKIFTRTLARRLRMLDSDPNRANHCQVIRRHAHRLANFLRAPQVTRDSFR